MREPPSQIEWFGPYAFLDCEVENVFSCKIDAEVGVYLLTIPFDGKFLVYYVGETGVSFSQLMLQHVQCYLNGFYRVFEPAEFSKGRKELVWGGMWKTDRKDPQLISEFLDKQEALSPKIVQFVKQFRIFLAPIDSDKRFRERIEAAIAKSLSVQSGLVGEFQDKDIRYRPTRQNEAKFEVKMTAPETIMGLAELLRV